MLGFLVTYPRKRRGNSSCLHARPSTARESHAASSFTTSQPVSQPASLLSWRVVIQLYTRLVEEVNIVFTRMPEGRRASAYISTQEVNMTAINFYGEREEKTLYAYCKIASHRRDVPKCNLCSYFTVSMYDIVYEFE